MRRRGGELVVRATAAGAMWARQKCRETLPRKPRNQGRRRPRSMVPAYDGRLYWGVEFGFLTAYLDSSFHRRLVRVGREPLHLIADEADLTARHRRPK